MRSTFWWEGPWSRSPKRQGTFRNYRLQGTLHKIWFWFDGASAGLFRWLCLHHLSTHSRKFPWGHILLLFEGTYITVVRSSGASLPSATLAVRTFALQWKPQVLPLFVTLWTSQDSNRTSDISSAASAIIHSLCNRALSPTPLAPRCHFYIWGHA